MTRRGPLGNPSHRITIMSPLTTTGTGIASFEIENPFPGGSTYSTIEIFQFDVGEWFWRDYMDHFMGPFESRRKAEASARATYEAGWKRISYSGATYPPQPAGACPAPTHPPWSRHEPATGHHELQGRGRRSLERSPADGQV